MPHSASLPDINQVPNSGTDRVSHSLKVRASDLTTSGLWVSTVFNSHSIALHIKGQQIKNLAEMKSEVRVEGSKEIKTTKRRNTTKKKTQTY